MRPKLKFILPTINVTVALMLLDVGRSHPVPNYRAPEIRLAHAINAPAMFLRYPLLRLWDDAQIKVFKAQIADDVIFLFCVAASWYLMGQELGTRNSRQTSLQPRVLGWKCAIDVALILMGLILTLFSWNSARPYLLFERDLWTIANMRYTVPAALEAFLIFAWGLFFIIKYSCQLWYAVSRRQVGEPSSV